MLWMVHPKGNGGGDPPSSLPSYPSFQGKKGIIPSRNEEDYSEDYDELPVASPSFEMALGSNEKSLIDENLHWLQKINIERIRLDTQKFMASSSFGRLYLNFFLILSIFSCGQYIYQTYPQQDLVRFLLTIIEIILAAMFFCDWCLSLFLAEQRWDHFWSFFALVDFATVVPTLLVNIFFRHRLSYHEIHNFHDAMNYLVHGAYTLRILRALRVQKKLNLITDEVDRFLYSMLLSVITMVLFDAAVMQYLESHVQDLPFHTWMYYTVVTICTVGYGDISPQSGLGKLFCIFVILFAIVYLPQQTNELIDKMNIFSVYARKGYVPIGQAKHVIICGDLRTTFLEEFFCELFHEDHENLNLNAVILQPESPSPEMHAILRDPNFGIVVHYLAGSPLNNHDLIRARVDIAVAVFIMGNKFSLKPDEDDARTILQYFSIQRFLRTQSHHVEPLYCMQLIRPENRRHLGTTVTDEDRQEIIICLNEMKMGLIAKTCMYPGTSTLIFNLLTSFADTGEAIEDDDEAALQRLMEDHDLDNDPTPSPGHGRGHGETRTGGGGGGGGIDGNKKILDKLDEEGSDDDKSDGGRGGGGGGGGGNGIGTKTNSMNFLRRLSKEGSNLVSQLIPKMNSRDSAGGGSDDSGDSNGSDSDDSDDSSEVTVKGGYWMNEYQKGCDWEIYTTEMADKFEGIKFIDLAKTLYLKLGVVLFGLRITDLNLVTNRVRVILNPADFIIPSKLRCHVEGFVLAKNQAAANLSFTGNSSSSSPGSGSGGGGGGSSDQISHLEMIANTLIKSKPPHQQNVTGMRKRHSITARSPIVVLPGGGGIGGTGTSGVGGTSSGIKPIGGSVGGGSGGGPTGVGWSTLLGIRTNGIQQEEMHQSRQEREQKLEIENLKNNFFIRQIPADLLECTIKTNVTDEYPFIRDHMIVISKRISSLYDFIRPLRAKYLGKLKHIVILFPYHIPGNIWRKLSQFEGILYVRGSPLEENDIKRAGIFRASQVVVLADPDISSSSSSSSSDSSSSATATGPSFSSSSSSSSSSAYVDALIDADAIFTYNCVKRLNEKAQVVIEVIQQQNISYLELKSSDIDYKFTPNFASGMLFTSSMLDAVVCQAFYNPQIIRVLYKLISGTDHIPDKSHGEKKPFLSEKSQSRGLGLKAISGSSLYQIPIPDGFHMKTYGQLFEFYAKDDNICIALLRGLAEGTTIGPTLNRLPYVYTNPPVSAVVYRWDRVFILSQKVLTSTKASVKEVLESFAHANNCVTLKRNLDLEEHTAHRDMSEISSTQRTLEKAISALTVDVAHRFEDVLAKQRGINESFGALSRQESNEMSEKDDGAGGGGTRGSPMVHKAVEKMNSRTVGFSRASSRITADRSNSNQNQKQGMSGDDRGSPSPSSSSNNNNKSGSSSSSQQRSARIKQEIKRRKSVVSSKNKLELSSQHSLPLSGSSTSQSSPDAHHQLPPRRISSQSSSTTNSDRATPTYEFGDSVRALNAMVTDEDVASDAIATFTDHTPAGNTTTTSSC